MITQTYSNFKTSGVGSSDENGRVGHWTFLDTNSKVRTILYYNTYKKLKKRYISDLGYQFNLILSLDKNGKQIGKNGLGYFIEFDSVGNEAKKFYVSKNSVDSIHLFYSNIIVEKIIIDKNRYPGEKTIQKNYNNGNIQYQFYVQKDTQFQKSWYESGKLKAFSKIYMKNKFKFGNDFIYNESGQIKKSVRYDTISSYDFEQNKYITKGFESIAEYDENGISK